MGGFREFRQASAPLGNPPRRGQLLHIPLSAIAGGNQSAIGRAITLRAP